MMAILMCFWTHRAIWVKSIATLELLEPLETLAKRAARSASSDNKVTFAVPVKHTMSAKTLVELPTLKSVLTLTY